MVNGVQQLDPNYIKAVNPQVVEQWVQEGKVKKQGNAYYVVGSTGYFMESCFVKGTDGNIKTYQLDGKGTIVERRTPKDTGEVVAVKKDTTVPINVIITDSLGTTPDSDIAQEFIKFLKDPNNEFNLQFDDDGNIVFGDNITKEEKEAILNPIIEKFGVAHPEKFTAPPQGTATFTTVTIGENTDQEVINKLIQDGIIEARDDSATTRTYTIKDQERLYEALPDSKNVQYEKADTQPITVNATVTTTTTKKTNMLEVPEGVKLRDDKDARKQLEAEAREAYSNMVADANDGDLQMRDAIDLYIAERKYNDKIEKRMAELETRTIGDGKEKRTSGAIVQLYLDEYANDEERTRINNLVDTILSSDDPNDKKQLLAIIQSTEDSTATDLTKLSDDTLRKGALTFVIRNMNIDSGTLLRLMAVSDVMGARSDEQKIKDDQYFINEQAKDFVRNRQAEQDIKDTTVHFSKSQRKNAPDDGRIHTDIGDAGRKLVDYCPELLCDSITAEEFKGHENDEENGYIKRTIDGETKYFKFSPEKWQSFMGALCDPTTITDKQMSILFGSDEEAKKRFIEDLNMTLQEGRQPIGNLRLPTSIDGKSDTILLNTILGGDSTDGKISNRDLNKLRGMVESAGYSVDKNTTGGKRLLYVMKNAAIGYGVGFATGGLGSLLGGAIDYAGKTAGKIVEFSGLVDVYGDTEAYGTGYMKGQGSTNGDVSLTDDVTLEYHVSVKTTDTYTDQYGTTSVTHNTPVSGTTSGTVTLEGNVTVYGDSSIENGTGYVQGQGHTRGQVNLEKEVEGDPYEGTVNDHHLGQANRAGMAGGVAAAMQSLFTMGGVEERGRNLDTIFDPVIQSSTEEETTEGLRLHRLQYNKVETRSGSSETRVEVHALKAVQYRGPASYSILYQYENGEPVNYMDFAKAYQEKIGGDMSKGYFYVYPELTVNGQKIVPRKDYMAQYNKITTGDPGTSNEVELQDQSYTRKTNLEAIIR